MFEAWCKDTTGHNFITLRITRNTEEEVYEELSGQITDGYFENYYGGIVRYTEMSDKYRISVKNDIFPKLLQNFDEEFAKCSPEYAYTICDDFRATVLALLCNLDKDPSAIKKRLENAHSAVNNLYHMLYGWEKKPDPTNQDREDYKRAIAEYRSELKNALVYCETKAAVAA